VRDYFSGAYFPLDLFRNLENVTFSDFTATQKRLREYFRIEAIKLAHPGGSFGYSVQTENKKFVFLGDNEFTTSQSEELKKVYRKSRYSYLGRNVYQKRIAVKERLGTFIY
jgi:hypothetical protein